MGSFRKQASWKLILSYENGEAIEMWIKNACYKITRCQIDKTLLQLKNGWKCKLHLLYEIKNILIINELNITPINLFLCIFLLLHFEDMLHNEMLIEPTEIVYHKYEFQQDGENKRN